MDIEGGVQVREGLQAARSFDTHIDFVNICLLWHARYASVVQERESFIS